MSNIIQFPKQKKLNEKVQLSANELLKDFNSVYETQSKNTEKELQKSYMKLLSNKGEK